MEVQLQSAQADLKSAQKRIEQLHGALKDHEEYSGDEMSSRVDSYDNLSSTGGSYSLDDGASLDFSDDDDDDEEDIIMMPKSSRSLDRRKDRDLSPVPEYKSKRRSSKEMIEEEDEFEASRKARQRRLQQLEEEEQQAEAARKARQERLKSLEEDDPYEASRQARQERLKDLADDDDDDFESSRKARQRRLQDQDKEPARKSSLPSSSRLKKTFSEEEDEDDDDLEEFLLKQRERMRKLADTDDEEEEDRKTSTLKSSRQRDDSPVTNGKSNGIHSKKAGSREPSEEPSPATDKRKDSVDEGTSRQRRKRQRRRTIEQLTSPEHQAAKANGVDL